VSEGERGGDGRPGERKERERERQRERERERETEREGLDRSWIIRQMRDSGMMIVMMIMMMMMMIMMMVVMMIVISPGGEPCRSRIIIQHCL